MGFREVADWFRARFALTPEEKRWLILLLVILWAGLVGTYLRGRNRLPVLLSPEQVAELQQSTGPLPPPGAER